MLMVPPERKTDIMDIFRKLLIRERDRERVDPVVRERVYQRIRSGKQRIDERG